MILRYLVLTFALSVAAAVGSSHLRAIAEMQAQVAEASTQPQGDAVRGKMVFEHRCTGCHALDANREGPQLRTVYGRKAGSVTGFEYSAGIAHLDLTWNARTLDRWLTDPDAMAPGNNMSFPTPKAADRRDVIAYLQEAAVKVR